MISKIRIILPRVSFRYDTLPIVWKSSFFRQLLHFCSPAPPPDEIHHDALREKRCERFLSRSHHFLSQLYIFTKMYNNNAYNEMITNINNNVYNTAGIILFVNS